jgi:hypothetical protein
MPGVPGFEASPGGPCLRAFDFAGEPRNLSWAPRIEQLIYETLNNTEVVLHLAEVGCRSKSGRILLIPSDPHPKGAEELLQNLQRLADEFDMYVSSEPIAGNHPLDGTAYFYRMDSGSE